MVVQCQSSDEMGMNEEQVSRASVPINLTGYVTAVAVFTN
jgi:hypothetical protein